MKLHTDEERDLWRDVMARSMGNKSALANVDDVAAEADRAVEEYRKRLRGAEPVASPAVDEAARRMADAANVALTHAAAARNAHSKQWVIDQMLRILLGDTYAEWVKRHDRERPHGCPRWSEGDEP